MFREGTAILRASLKLTCAADVLRQILWSSQNLLIKPTVVLVLYSTNQCPVPDTMSPPKLVAALRVTITILSPKDLSPPMEGPA